MANELAITGNTRLTWSLTDTQPIGSVTRSAEQKSSRSVSNGTGPNEANCAWSAQYTITGVGSLSLNAASLAMPSFGYSGNASLTQIKEVLLSVATGPTGGYVTFGMPTGATGVRVNVGGQFHWLDYLAGVGATGSFVVQNAVTGTYSVNLSVVGNGTYVV